MATNNTYQKLFQFTHDGNQEQEYFLSYSISASVNGPLSDYLATCTVLISFTILMKEDPALTALNMAPPPEKT